MRLSACGQVCSYPLITFALFICVVVCAGPFLSAVHLLLALVVPVSVDLCRASRVASFSWCCGAPLFRCCCSVFCCSCCLFVGCPCGLVLAVWPALSCCPPPTLPLWLSPGFFWSSQCSAGPSLRISGCICNGPVVIPLVWRVVVDWLLSSLRSLATKASALCGALPSTPCCGCCSCASRSVTRYSPSCDPVYPSDTPKAARARLLGFCCFLPPVLLPSRASALSFLAGLRLFPSPRALVLLGFVCPPCGPLSWLVLVAPPSVCFWFVLLAWPVLWFVWFAWFRCVVRPWLVSLFCVLLLVASPHVILDRYARIYFDFTCTTKAFIIIGLVCLSTD